MLVRRAGGGASDGARAHPLDCPVAQAVASLAGAPRSAVPPSSSRTPSPLSGCASVPSAPSVPAVCR
eukprot:20972-Chlamydomonas_euryale.AAC.1